MDMKENQKKKYRGKYRCNRCHYTSNKKEFLKRHKALIHGDFGAREKIQKKRYKPEFKEPYEKIFYGKINLLNDEKLNIKYVWDKKTGIFRIYTNETKFGKNIEIVFDNNKQKYNIKNYDRLVKKYTESNSNGKNSKLIHLPSSNLHRSERAVSGNPQAK